MAAGKVSDFVVTVEKVKIISFKIAGTTYQAEESMTWAEWVYSSYNTGEFDVGSGDNEVWAPGGPVSTKRSVSGIVHGTDFIEKEASYQIIYGY